MERRFRQAQRPELLFGVPTRFPSYVFSIKRAQQPQCRGEKKEKENVECFLRQLELEKKEKLVEDSLSLTRPNTPASKKKEEENGECSLRQLELEKKEKLVEDSLSLTRPNTPASKKKEEENGECSLRQLELEKKEKFVEDSLILTEPNTPASKKKEEEKLCEKRRILKEEWDKWVSEWKQLHKEEKWQRQLLRDGEASDEESEESEEKVLLRRVQVWVGFTHEEQGRKMERIKKEDPLSRYQLQPCA
ncbi:hypothetical protein FF1_034161 [Malus domestica]|uniref:uncharacterized protein n=1 Tax=Malus domestica TaxID=3750 RepID=UPI00397570C7